MCPKKIGKTKSENVICEQLLNWDNLNLQIIQYKTRTAYFNNFILSKLAIDNKIEIIIFGQKISLKPG